MAQHNYPTIGQAFLGTKILSASATLAGTDSGKAFSNASASGNITVTLPQAKPGYTFQFLEVAAHNIVVTPQATDNIRGLSAGTSTTLSAAGSLLYLECINAGTWEIVISQPIVAGISSVAAGTGIAVSTVAGVATVSNTGVLSIAGTANQIAASAATGAVTLSFPANVIIPAPPSGNALVVNGVASSFASQVNASTASGHSFGLDINAGSTSTDIALEISNAINSVNYMVVWGDGHIELGSNVGSGTQGVLIGTSGDVVINTPSTGACLTLNGAAGNQIGIFNGATANCYFDYKVGGTIIGRVGTSDSIASGGVAGNFGISCTGGGLDFCTGASIIRLAIDSSGNAKLNGLPVALTGSFTAGTTGLSAATIAAKYTVTGNSVTLFLAKPSTIVSNATTFTITGLPAAIQPTTAKYAACNPAALNASSFGAGFLSALVSGSTITLALNGTTWTATGNKNYADATSGATFVYDLN